MTAHDRRTEDRVNRSLSVVGCLALIVGACGSSATTPSDGTQPPSASVASVATGSASPNPSRPPSSPALVLPPLESPRPARVFPIDNAPINLAASDDVVWAVGDKILLRIDTATNATREYPIPVDAGSGSIGAASGALWIADWTGNAVHRVDPATAAIVATIKVAAPVGVVATQKDVWVGSEGAMGVVRIDPLRNAVTMSIDQRGGFAVAEGNPWFAQRDDDVVIELDGASSRVVGSVQLPAAALPGVNAGPGGCFVGGRVPDAWWAWCYTQFGASVPVRIDPATHLVTGIARVGGKVSGGVVVVGDLSWFVLDSSLVAVDRRNVVTRRIDLGDGVGADNAILAADSLWVPDENGRQIIRIALADLR